MQSAVHANFFTGRWIGPASLYYTTEKDALMQMRASSRDLEERLLRADVRRSPDEAGKFLASDFIEFGGSGAVYSRQQILDALAKETPMELSATDFSVRVLCDDVVLVTYRAARNDPASGQQWHSLRSSIWKFVDGRWLMSFHQALRHGKASDGAYLNNYDPKLGP